LSSIYGQIASTGSPVDFETELPLLLLGLLVLLIELFYQRSEAFDRLVGSRIRGPLYSAYGTFGLPLMLVLMEVLMHSSKGGILKFLSGLVLVVILIFIGILGLIAFLIYRFLRGRR